MTASLDDLNQRHVTLCADIKERTNQMEWLQVELDELHAKAEQLERVITRESNNIIRQEPQR